MKYINLHTHSNFCDGQNPLEDYVKQALQLDNEGIGFSSHAPIGIDSNWHMNESRVEDYISEVKRLEAKYADEIEIYVGLEVDYLDDGDKMFPMEDYALDYIIGSVHYLGESNHIFCIDDSVEEFENGLSNYFDGRIDRLVESYYGAITRMVNEYEIDIIGHFDLIKKLNGDNRYFDDSEDWYKQIVLETIYDLKATNPVFEIYSRGFYKKYSTQYYPSDWIVEQLILDGARITLSSDAHQPQELNQEFDNLTNRLVKFGLNEISVLSKGKWTNEKLKPIANRLP